jgi:hypothetical protein
MVDVMMCGIKTMRRFLIHRFGMHRRGCAELLSCSTAAQID